MTDIFYKNKIRVYCLKEKMKEIFMIVIINPKGRLYTRAFTALF
jgi:hypothetical protein